MMTKIDLNTFLRTASLALLLCATTSLPALASSANQGEPYSLVQRRAKFNALVTSESQNGLNSALDRDRTMLALLKESELADPTYENSDPYVNFRWVYNADAQYKKLQTQANELTNEANGRSYEQLRNNPAPPAPLKQANLAARNRFLELLNAANQAPTYRPRAPRAKPTT